ncbi:peptidase M16 [Sphingopyxis sp. H038]|uniref:M16 family metallopeptidase n=1 Tax=unclassified Sphingopyxis TaxID=2614943 RepID=UPI000730F017|nr:MULTISPECIES: pitrilysin family protein [unclassified Sphingopyxis]KTE02375.1 peptidase M16 [Sphingopyxis sp. H012]KTE09641.1 peptidase M16 [Sphingopyxis sp. H093]KTE10936.1 peptidase M16 [Sphingopyxis sp. H053]KTE26079.1 peptidase M16 [Sphingopyxis sp. H080]KTE35423.1 peptidase M16 [Sphingopyxis sp. H038]
MPRFHRFALALAVTTSLVAAGPALAKAKAANPAPIADLVKAVDIPYEAFTLDNGLRVIVHEDRKAPVVAVSVWYRVGSKHEPKGKTGFAHLFEHLMFNGSENSPGDFFEPLQQVGATDSNGTTNVDRTNYFETVPTGALDRALFLESDRMGHLLGAVTQEKLDNQRGVVQNEKRQGDNNPYGLLRYEIFENLFPTGHPYHHSTIGSMGDLNSASLGDVKKWFTDNYGPNNAVLVLAGDVNVATAKAKVQEWFGDIPRGPEIAAPKTSIPTLPAPLAKEVKDLVPTTRIYRMWAIPGLNDPEAVPLQMAMGVLGGLSSSRLDNALVRKDPVAVSVSAAAQPFEDAGILLVQADVKPGVDPQLVASRLDAEIASFLASGPTADELQRTAASYLAGTISGLESVGGFGGKAVTLAEGALYSNNPAYYKVELDRMAKATPEQVKAVANKWLSRPAFSLTYTPGERTEGGENRGGAVTGGKVAAPVQPDRYWNEALGDVGPDTGGVSSFADRSQLPAVADLKALDFPAIERTKLKNGVEVVFARRTTVPTVNVAVSFDAGYAADPHNALGTQSLMLSLMDEGTTSLDSIAFAEAKERLGAQIDGTANADETVFSLFALKPNLGASLSLLADYIRNPAFDSKELERVRAQQLNRLKAELNNPNAIASRILTPVLYGADHPYGIPPSGLGNAKSVAAVTQGQLAAFHSAWIRPDNARVFVVGDTTLAEVKKQLDTTLGQWQAPATAKPVKHFEIAIPAPRPRILLFDRPKSPQSVILAGKVLDAKGGDDLEILRSANDIFGGNFLSRFNTNLRETKGWSYGVRSRISGDQDRLTWVAAAPVQADRTGDSIKELQSDLKSFLGDKGVTKEELERTINGSVRELPGSFETSGDVLGGIRQIVKFGRPDNYYETLPATYEAMTAAEIDAAARKALSTDGLVYVVVGDAAVVKPQLDGLGLPVETVSLDN